MQHRKFPKPARTKKKPLEQLSTVISRHEPLILIISAVLSSIGIIAAAASTWLAWRQVDMMAQERLTPFRTAMYERQLETRSKILDAMSRFEDAALCIEVDHRMTQLRGVSTDRRRDCVFDMKPPFKELEASVKRSILEWPEETRVLMMQYMIKGAEIQECASQALLFYGPVEDGIPRTDCAMSYKSEKSKLLKLNWQIQRQTLADIERIPSD